MLKSSNINWGHFLHLQVHTLSQQMTVGSLWVVWLLCNCSFWTCSSSFAMASKTWIPIFRVLNKQCMWYLWRIDLVTMLSFHSLWCIFWAYLLNMSAYVSSELYHLKCLHEESSKDLHWISSEDILSHLSFCNKIDLVKLLSFIDCVYHTWPYEFIQCSKEFISLIVSSKHSFWLDMYLWWCISSYTPFIWYTLYESLQECSTMHTWLDFSIRWLVNIPTVCLRILLLYPLMRMWIRFLLLIVISLWLKQLCHKKTISVVY